MKLTTHLHSVLRLRICGVILPLLVHLNDVLLSYAELHFYLFVPLIL